MISNYLVPDLPDQGLKEYKKQVDGNKENGKYVLMKWYLKEITWH
jgi:hypothetical protein